MTCGIYSITNKETGKMYIGQSIDIERRFKQHCIRTKKNNSYIDNSIRKHGKNAFEFKILLECDESELCDEEHKFIKLFGTYKNGYNLTWGGEVNPSKCPEIAKKISESNKGEKHYMCGKTWSDNHRLNLSKKRKKNTTGFFRVHKRFKKEVKQGFTWTYQHYGNNGYTLISNIDLMKLKEKVIAKGFIWEIIDENNAKQSLKENAQNIQQNKKIDNRNTTGYYHVYKDKDPTCNQGFLWTYNYLENGVRRKIRRVDINKLEEVVKSKGLEWRVIDGE